MVEYTGYTDKNGNEIYEGDLIKVTKQFSSNNLLHGEICGNFVVVSDGNGDWRGEYDDGWCLYTISASEFMNGEVVGSKYDDD